MRKNAQFTNIIFRALGIALLISALFIGLYIFLYRAPTQALPVENQPPSKAPVIMEPAPVMKQGSTSVVSVEEKIPSCMGRLDLEKMPKNLNDLKNIFWEKVGPPEKEKMQWRNLHFTEADGSKRRLRVSLGASSAGVPRYEMRLFAVDEEDLPIPLETIDSERFNPTRDILQKYVQGKRITFDSTLTEYQYSDGATLEIEVENSVVKILHYRGKDFSVGCSLEQRTNALDCACIP